MALIRTDYGLIYNTDGSLCATLLPEGGVEVEEGTTNLVPSNRLKFEGWIAYSGAQVTLTQNVEFPEIGRNDATRIRTTGGTSSTKYYIDIERPSIANQAYTGSVYIKNIGSKPVRFHVNIGPTVTVNPGEWTRAIISVIGNGTSNFQLKFMALNVDDDLDFIAWGPQAEHKPFATSFVDGTRAGGVLDYPIQLSGDFTIAFYWWVPISQLGNKDRTVLALSNGTNVLNFFQGWTSDWYLGDETKRARFRLADFAPAAYTIYHIVLRRQGEVVSVFRDGALWDTVDFGAAPNFTTLRLGGLSPQANLPNSVYDELLILPYAVSPETIATWHSLDAPFFDPREQIDAGSRTIRSIGTGGSMEIGKNGIQAIRSADGVKVLDFDINTGNFKVIGDISGSTGTFADGNVKLDERGLVIIHPDTGNYTILNAGTLAFYEAGQDDPRWYVKRTLAGTVSSGTYVPLDWDEEPKVILMPHEIVTYQQGLPHETQKIKMFVVDKTEKGFRPYCELWAEGGATQQFIATARAWGSSLPSEAVFPHNTLPSTTRIRVAGVNRHTFRVAQRVTGETRIYYTLWYREVGGEWKKWGDYSTHVSRYNGSLIEFSTFNVDSNWEHLITGLTPGEYQIKVVFNSITYQRSHPHRTNDPYVDIREIECWSTGLLGSGEVSFLAIEGG